MDVCAGVARGGPALTMARRAFTLLEVLAALTIFATAAIVLGTAYLNVLNGYAHAERATRVDADVQFVREVLFRQPDREKAEEGGEFTAADGRRLSWRVEIEPTEVADLFEVHLEVEIEVRAGAEPEPLQERFRLLRPTWSEDDERERLRQEASDRINEFLARRPS